MKKIKKAKLALDVETVKLLNEPQMKGVAGGITNLGTQCYCLPTYNPTQCEPSYNGYCPDTWNCGPSGRGC